jgi:hypothetical protein
MRRIGRPSAHEHADPSHSIGLLCARRERPSRRRAAEQGDELAASHHSITSLARGIGLLAHVRMPARDQTLD